VTVAASAAVDKNFPADRVLARLSDGNFKSEFIPVDSGKKDVGY
jgi:hypothetical protein